MKIGNLSDKQVTIIGASICGVLALLILFLSYREVKKIGDHKKLPAMLQSMGKEGKKKAKKMKDRPIAAQISVSLANIEQYEADIARKDELIDKINRMRGDWEKLEEELPKSTNFSELMNAIYKGARDYNIKIDSITRDDPVVFDSYTNKVNLQLTGIEGGFHDFGNFLYYLYVPLKRFIVLQDFSITSGAGSTISEAGEKVKHTIRLELVTFVEKKVNQ